MAFGASMKYLDEYRNADAARQLATAIAQATTRPWSIMEVCGGQTHAILRFALDEMLPPQITLIHGPGCPVCVTPWRSLTGRLIIAARPEVDLLLLRRHAARARLAKDSSSVKSEGGDVRIVYSPMDAVKLGAEEPRSASRLFRRRFRDNRPGQRHGGSPGPRLGLTNFSVLVSHVLVPPAMRAVLCFARLPRARLSGGGPRMGRSWALPSTSRSPGSTTFRSWSRALSQWTFSKGC